MAREPKSQQGVLARMCCEKQWDGAGEGATREVGQNFSGTNILVLGPGNKHNIAQPQDWGQEEDMDQRPAQEGENKITPDPQRSLTHFQIGQEEWTAHCNRLHRKWESCLQGGENLSIKTYLHKAQVCTSQGAGSMLEAALVIFLSLPLSFTLPFIQNPPVFTWEDKGLTHQFPCQVYNLPIKRFF